MRCGIFWIGFIFVGAVVNAAETARVFNLDPVALVSGAEIEGREEVSVIHQGMRYQFKTDENKKAFESDPARYEVQMGGACARMGPLSGEGQAQYFAVSDEKIYIFASESCRERFLENPAHFLDPDEPAPTGDENAHKRGRAFIEKAVLAVGGAERLDATTGLAERSEKMEESRGEQVKTTKLRAFTFPDAYFREDTWGDLNWGIYLKGDEGRFVNNDGSRPMAPVQMRALRRFFQTQPLYILKSRGRADFVAVHEGSDTVNGRPVERIAVGFDGLKVSLYIDAENGRILKQAYRGRGPEMWFGTVAKTFEDFQDINGLALPTAFTIAFEGKLVSGKKQSTLSLNEKLAPPIYKSPAKTEPK